MHSKTPLPKTANDSNSFIVLRDVHKDYSAQQGQVHALRGANMQVTKGEFVAIVGPSGCGKSTLLNLLGGIDAPSSGTLSVNGWNLGEFNETQLTEYRRHGVGIIFQFFNLLPLLSVLENVLLPTQLAGNNRNESQKSAIELLELVGLQDKINEPASHLSGGQMQRVAVVRAMINDPLLLLADEPTGNLDSTSANDILKVLSQLSAARRTTVLMVTHSKNAASVAGRILSMRDGIFED
jgi:ABC-type lipoprotein export system ATPase subunit